MSKLFQIDINNDNIGNIPYLQISKEYVITENFFTGELELNSLKTYEWHILTAEEIADILTNKSIFHLQKGHVILSDSFSSRQLRNS